MALAHLTLITILPSSSCCFCGKCKDNLDRKRFVGLAFGNGKCSGTGLSRCVSVSRVSRRRDLGARPWELNATDTHIVENAPSLATTATVEIPVSCFQLVGVADRAEKDEIVKSVMQLKNAEVEEGYTLDAVKSRQDLLMDVRDKLLFEPEYAGNLKEKIPPKSSLRIPWPWLPGALCLLQEIGEEKLVLDIGQEALKHPDAKPYIHDVLLSMALAECAIAKISFEKNKVSNGFEALARAQCLLRSKISLGKMALLSLIEESLEELAPACTLELLGMPHSPEHVERRRGAIAALRELLRQGLDVETSCRVQDWQSFLSQALNRLMATEIVDLLPWEDLAIMRKNKKSIESHNQRVVIDFNCFYVVLIAHIALGFSSKQTELINKAKVICECLIASEGIDLKFEEAFCLFLLGQGNEAQAVEKLQQLELNSNSAGRSLVSVKEKKDFSSGKQSLETWLKDAVLAVFPDTRDCSPSFVNFFSGEKRSLSSKKRITQTNYSVARRSISDIAVKRMDCGESVPHAKPSQNLGFAVKQLAPTNLQSSLIVGKSDSSDDEPSAQLKRNINVHHRSAWQSWLIRRAAVGKIIIVAAVGCIVFFPFGLSRRLPSKLPSKPGADVSSLLQETDSALDNEVGPFFTKQSSIEKGLKKLLTAVKVNFRKHSEPKSLLISEVSDRMSSSKKAVLRKQMPVEEAEALVKQWQAIKAESLGRSHHVASLSEILDESMLAQWQVLADAAKARSCYWRFVLLELSVLQADIISVGFGVEMAEIEALIEEAAELVDESLEKNPNYYGTYKVHYVLKRQDDGLWRFCDCDIQSP